eukprot:jgi/Astpho2/3086/Aster-x0560
MHRVAPLAEVTPIQRWKAQAGQAVSSGAAGVSSDFTLKVGALVEICKDTRALLALLERPDGKRNWFAKDVRGHSHSVTPKQISYVLPGAPYEEADLLSIHEQTQAEADSALMALAWEMSADEPDALLSVPQMAQLLYARSDPVACYASHRLLNEDRVYFRQVGRAPPTFQPRAQRDVDSLLAKQQAEQRAAEELQDFLQQVQAARQKPLGSKPSPASWLAGNAHSQRVLAVLAYGLDEADTAQTKLAIDTMHAVGRSASVGQALDLLQDLGVWRLHEQRSLIKAGVVEHFPPDVMEQARTLELGAAPSDPDAAGRADLTGQVVFTIDDASTRDIDDGLSAEFLPDGRVRLWVHIADPTRFIALGSPLELEARHRTRTLYMPHVNVPMFPRELSEGLFSLQQGRQCCTLSVSVVLGPDGNVQEQHLMAATIVPSRRVPYDQADELLQTTQEHEEPELHALRQASRATKLGSMSAASLPRTVDAGCQCGFISASGCDPAAEARWRWRRENGAADVDLPEANLRVRDAHAPGAAVTCVISQRNFSPARQLVQEMMILAGQVVGDLGGKAGLALPYRSQESSQPLPEAELEAVPPGPCRAILQRHRMMRSITSCAGPQPHASLALPAYVQMSSPIRRHGDLLTHYQLKAHLRGEHLPFSAVELDEVVGRTAGASRELGLVEREVSAYWTAEFFRQQRERDADQTWSALLLQWIRVESGLARVLLQDLGLETVMRIDRPASPGDVLDVRCKFVDVPTGRYTLTEAEPIWEETAAIEVAQTGESYSSGEDEEDLSDATDFPEQELP